MQIILRRTLRSNTSAPPKKSTGLGLALNWNGIGPPLFFNLISHHAHAFSLSDQSAWARPLLVLPLTCAAGPLIQGGSSIHRALLRDWFAVRRHRLSFSCALGMSRTFLKDRITIRLGSNTQFTLSFLHRHVIICYISAARLRVSQNKLCRFKL